MKLVSFRNAEGNERIGAWLNDDDGILDLKAANDIQAQGPHEYFINMLGFIEAGKDALSIAQEYISTPVETALVSKKEIKLLSPLPVPAQIRCFSVFEKHARQSAQVMMKIMANNSPHPEQALEEFRASGKFNIPPVFYERPLYYKGNRFSVTGTQCDIHWPEYSNVIDYELELAAIIGKRGKDITADNARDYIFGFSVFNDLTARDEQSREMVAPLGPAKGKDFDGGNVLGPCIVTADELTDPYNLRMSAKVNGELWSEGNSDDMTHSFEDMLTYVSRSETVFPGEVFLSGCVGGGCGMEQERYPSRGDAITLAIEGIGELHNRIV